MDADTLKAAIQIAGPLVGVLVGAWLTARHAKRMEPFKSEIAFESRKKEIIFLKLYDKRLETLEGISKISAKLMSDMREFDGHLENISKGVYKNESDLQVFSKAKDSLFASFHEFGNFCRDNSLYVPACLLEDIQEFMRKCKRLFVEKMDRQHSTAIVEDLKNLQIHLNVKIRDLLNQDPSKQR